MFLETIRSFTDRMNDGTAGVNAKLAGVPRSGGDGAPPNVALIADETRNIYAAFGRMPDQATSYPCLLASQQELGIPLDPQANAGTQRDGSVHILVRYGQLEADAVKGTRNLHYTFRALERVIEEWMQNTPEAARTVGSVCVYWTEAMSIQPAWAKVGDKVVTGAFLVTFRARDTAPVN